MSSLLAPSRGLSSMIVTAALVFSLGGLGWAVGSAVARLSSDDCTTTVVDVAGANRTTSTCR